jgi:DNA-binding transcriptional MerR regulator
MDEQAKLLSIEEMSFQLKVPKHTLRFWEKAVGGILVPLRTPGGQRRYTFKDIYILEEIKKLRAEGLGLAEIKRKLNDPGQMNRDASELTNIELLANRVAEVVKTEIYSFFQARRGNE